MSNLKYSIRILRSRPAFVALITAVLGLGLAANATMFTVVNGLLLRPLPYAAGERLIAISRIPRNIPIDDLGRAGSVEQIASFTLLNQPIGDDATPLLGMRSSINLFKVLGVNAVLGRVFAPDIDEATSPVVVLSYEYWRRTSNDPAIIGRPMIMASQRRTVIGVLPPDFVLMNRNAAFWIPDRLPQSLVVGRMATGASPVTVQAELRSIVRGLISPGSVPSEQQIQVTPMSQSLRAGTQTAETVLLLQAAVGFVLLITSANVASLLLTWSRGRQKEFAIRAAVGAGRLLILRQIFLESLLLTSTAAAFALALTWASVGFIAKRLPDGIAARLFGADPLAIDYRVLAFTVGLSMIVVLLCGLATTAGSLRLDLVSALQSSSRTFSSSRGRASQILASCEVGLAIMLLIGAGLILKGMWRLETASLGFDPKNVIRARFDPGAANYPTAEQRLQVFTRLIESMKNIPGVESVGTISPQIFPFSGTVAPSLRFVAETIPDVDVRADVLVVNSEYFGSVGVPILRGRTFSNVDSASATPVVVISEELAKRYWGDRDPVGLRIRLAEGPVTQWASIIGVAGDVRSASRMEWQPLVYRPITQAPPGGIAVMIRTAASGNAAIVPAVRSQMKMIDSAVPQYPIVDLDSALSTYWDGPRFNSALWAAFACFGVLLAALGVYGTLRLWVAGHVEEFAIRVAIGAEPRDIVVLVMRRSFMVCSLGLALGIGGALALRRVIATQLRGVSPVDPAVFISVSALIVVVALFATLLPARSAANTDPLVAMKQ